MGEWVQTLAVDKNGTHEATIRCVAAASALARYRHPDTPEWLPWETLGNTAKAVRKAGPNILTDLSSDPATAAVSLGSSRAVARVPSLRNALPDRWHRLPVAGLELRKHPLAAPDQSAFHVWIDADLGMTTGKAAAQAAHAVSAMVACLSDPDTPRWAARPTDFTVAFCTQARLATIARDAPVVIRDAGRTEVEPGTLTATATRAEGR